jgi:hypothetical protein
MFDTDNAEKFAKDSPKDIAPRIGMDTLSPELPNCVYETLVLSTLARRDSGMPASPMLISEGGEGGGAS